jgi:DNA-binding IclR family transcriptional regulator
MRMLRTAHLRDPRQHGRDRAINDSMDLLERAMVPGSVKSKKLEELWNTSQSTVSRRLKAVNALGLVSVEAKGRRYRLALGLELCRQHQLPEEGPQPWEPVT